MISKILSCALNGIDGYIVEVEVDLSSGLPSFNLVGLPDSAVKESIERVRTAIKNSNIVFPVKRITVNLAPADIKKEGPSFDLPIAVGILSSMEIIPQKSMEKTLFAGELSLDGNIRPINGILPIVYSAYKKGIKKFFIPYENREEASLVSGAEIYPVKNLLEIVNHFKELNKVSVFLASKQEFFNTDTFLLNFSDVKGQNIAKRAIEISAAGMHNILLCGPPGSGKTMLAKRIPSILPDLSFEESIEITKIYSVAGLLKDKSTLVNSRPFRSPHHTVSSSALSGGGRVPKPGEISLSHNGVLFLDELPEFQRNALEIMRQPLEDGKVTISRVNGTVTYPAKFMLVASMNPCPCGYYGSDKCHCSFNEITKYTNKISGPLLDRIDILINVSPVNYSDLDNKNTSETSEEIKSRVIEAQKIQNERYKNENMFFNSQLSASQIEKYCKIGKNESALLKSAFDKLNLSARAYHKILKVSRTIADLDSSFDINVKHLAEAIQYRGFERNYS